MLKKILLLYMFFVQHNLLAQNEGNIWYFGNNAGIDFNSGEAVAIADGKLQTGEGCATICDNAGQLLFYTDGSTIWNPNHEIMPNGTGLLGNTSSTQSAIIVKKPASKTIYYVFTIDDYYGPDGINYSEVDMSLQAGLGNVNANKNINVSINTTERIAAIKHQNGVDFWIVTQIHNSTKFECYLLTSNGLNPTPVISKVGIVLTGKGFIGYLKSSSNGSRLALACYDDYVGLFDFDNSTGKISNPMSFTGFQGQPYGIEFSPNEKILYVSIHRSEPNTPSVYQYNLLAGTNAEIDASKIPLEGWTYAGGALQLAPDGKIYQAINNSQTLGVIEKPNELGVACNFKINGFALRNSTNSQLGLPSFYNNIYINTSISYTNVCFRDSTLFNIYSSQTLDSVLWNFGDSKSDMKNTSKDTTPFHVFTDTGTFNVTLTSYLSGDSSSITRRILIKPALGINLGKDTSLCEGDSLRLDATTPHASYLWQNNTTKANLAVKNKGTYWVQVDVQKCSAIDTIIVGFHPLPSINFGIDTTICKNEELILNAKNKNATYLWQDSTTKPTLVINKKGTYWVEVSANGCNKTDTIIVDSVECNCNLFVANAFSPNADAINDEFSPIYKCNIDEYRFMIFNRWGEKIFESTNPNDGWDGTFNGKDSPNGVYIYVLAYHFSDQSMSTKYTNGNFTLIR